MNDADAILSVQPPRSMPRGSRRTAQALVLLLLAGLGGAALVLIASLTDRCGDGRCGDGEACALDCQLDHAPAPRPTPAPIVAAQAPPAPPAPAPPAPAPPAPAPPAPAPPTPAPPTPAPPAPAPPAPAAPAPRDEGRCAEPAFRSLAQALVKDCERACKKDESPLVDLSPEAFDALFGRADDAGVATHFALFGCNSWGRDNRTCLGFDSSIADPALCPPGAATCPADARALQAELIEFLGRNRDAHTLLLFGTASKTGNRVGAMSDDNARLAEERAHAVAEVVHAWRRQVGARGMRVLSVALDNTRTDYWLSPAFRAIIEAQAGSLRGAGRTFSALAPDAANRSVMVVALKCATLN